MVIILSNKSNTDPSCEISLRWFAEISPFLHAAQMFFYGG